MDGEEACLFHDAIDLPAPVDPEPTVTSEDGADPVVDRSRRTQIPRVRGMDEPYQPGCPAAGGRQQGPDIGVAAHDAVQRHDLDLAEMRKDFRGIAVSILDPVHEPPTFRFGSGRRQEGR